MKSTNLVFSLGMTYAHQILNEQKVIELVLAVID